MGLKTAEQLRAARAVLRITQRDLADLSGVSAPTIKRLEKLDGPLGVQMGTLQKLQDALEDAGIEFIPENGGGSGVRLRRRSAG